MQNVLVVIHVIIALILIVVVLMQHGKQQGLSGSIAGGAETFFGKNKGRTIDAILRKFTSVFAALFIISSVTLAIVSVTGHKASVEATQNTEAPASDANQAAQEVSLDEAGNLVDKDGNVIMTAEQMKQQEAEAATEAETEANTEAAAE